MILSDRWFYIKQVAKARLEHNKTSWHVSKYGEAIEVLGAAGELAARRFLGLNPQLHTEFDQGCDLEWRGYRVDVKTTKLTPKLGHRFLQWTMNRPLTADIVLMAAVSLSEKRATVVGWAWADEINRAPINKKRDFPCREIPVANLHPFWELFVLEKKQCDTTD